MNKVILMGRPAGNPEVRWTTGDSPLAIARWKLAVDRRGHKGADEQTADFISCTAFGSSAEFVEKYIRKGTKIVLTGRIQTGSYVNKDGVRVYTTEVVAEDIEFAESKKGATSESAQPCVASAGGGFMSIPEGIDEELPFL